MFIYIYSHSRIRLGIYTIEWPEPRKTERSLFPKPQDVKKVQAMSAACLDQRLVRLTADEKAEDVEACKFD